MTTTTTTTLPHRTPAAQRARRDARNAWLAVADARSRGDSPDVIAELERQARDLSDRMHEICGTYNPRTGQRPTGTGVDR